MNLFGKIAAVCGAAFLVLSSAQAAERQTLRQNMPAAALNARRSGPLSRLQHLKLAIGLPLRNTDELHRFIADLSDPTSASYRAFLTPEQFTERFGPTAADYQKVIDFAAENGLHVTGTHANRMLLDVSGDAPAIEKAFHTSLSAYADRARGGFFAPDREPSVDAGLPILSVSGLDNYTLPKPMDVKASPLARTSFAGSGSGPAGLLLGKDFRAAYAPGVTLTGSEQAIGLFELDGFYPGDVQANFRAAGLPAVPVETVLLDGYDGSPGEANIEVILDIMMAAYMAPGAKIIVYEGDNWNDVLNRMATENRASQLSCSWGFSPIDATTEQIFLQMIAQGQSFFQASGDSGAYTGEIVPPSDNPNVTVVGGTALTTSGPGGAWLSENVWAGSGGGVSTTYSIPGYQQGMNLASLGGSNAMRNIPDVALTAAVQMYLIQNNGQPVSVGGTSAAAPLWAGFMALANQQAHAAGKPRPGFINPAIYALGKGTAASYQSSMHDILIGNNQGYSALPGFDLATGWGTPGGQKLIDLLTATTAPSFSLSAASTTLSVAPGGAVSAAISVVPQGGFDAAVVLSVSGLPSGVTGSFNTAGVLALSASPSAQPGNSSLTITGTSGSTVKTLALTLKVAPTATFSLSAAPATLTVAAGGSATSTISATPQNGFTGQVALSLSGLPSGVAGTFSPAGVLTLAAASTTTPGSYNVTVTGVSGAIAKTAGLALTVTAPPSFTLSATPSAVSIAQGTTGSSTIAVAAQNGFSAQVTLAVSGLPAGVTAAFASNGTLTLSVAKTAAAGKSNVTITGTSGALSKTLTLSLTVTGAPSFTLAASPASVTVLQGSTVPAAVTITPQNGFNSAVTFTASGLPSGVTAQVTAAGAITIAAASSAVPGTSSVTVTGTAGALSARATLSVTVAAAPDFTIATATPSLTIVQGFAGSGDIGIARLLGFVDAVNLTAGGLPAGVTATFRPLGRGEQNIVTFTSSPTTATGTTGVTLTGTAGTLVHSVRVNLTIVAPAVRTVPVNLSAVWNVTGIVADGVPFTSGGLDAGGRAYSGYLLGATQTVAGVPFAIGPMNAPDAVSGKTVPLPAGHWTAIKLLGTGVNGNQPSQTFTVTYTDGSKTSFSQGVSDWATPQHYPGETTAFTSSYRANSTGSTESRAFLLYQYSFALNSTKTVSSIALPATPNVVVLAIVGQTP